MAAPSPTVRGTPAGVKLKDGYQSFITFSNAPTISLWEKKLKPPGIDGGDKIEQTTMFNADWRTFAARQLMTMTDGSMTCAYDPNAYNQIIAECNREQTITVTFTDGSTLAFFGFLKSFEPSELSEGSQPEASVMFVATNFDPTNKVEAAPVLTSVSGT